MPASELTNMFETSLRLEEAMKEKEWEELQASIPLEMESTQKAADLYRSGQKLWIASDLERIEYELSHCKDMPSFTLRRFDGSLVSVKNPMYGVANPIWRPQIIFQDYWYLMIQDNPQAQLRDTLPYSFPYYSYFIEWENRTFGNFIASEAPSPDTAFEKVKEEWERSPSCDLLKRQLATVLGERKITKVLCFGLGDILLSSERALGSRYDLEMAILDQKKRLMQHMFGLTIATAARAGMGENVELFIQDPAYTQKGKKVLEKAGFTIVGDHGAGGLSKIDDNSAVFCCCGTLPMRQLIADLARPAIIVGGTFTHILTNKAYAPFACDTESPRSIELYKGYTRHDVGIVEPDQLELKDLKLFVRNEVKTDACVSNGAKVAVSSDN
ncbi:hypothetical protein F5Y13DRAFT_192306 [Hypoxylon sp. FL1857]|nr:hypothetical protein F5Y13DRAFT_192306 [Hypoxylon sp. FL1857]